MRIVTFAIFAAVAPLILSADGVNETINMGSSTGTVSFNGDGSTLTLVV